MGALDHLSRGAAIRIVVTAIEPVFLVDLETPECIRLALPESLQLLLLAHVEPELRERNAVLSEFQFELANLLVSASPVDLRRQAANAFDEDAAVP